MTEVLSHVDFYLWSLLFYKGALFVQNYEMISSVLCPGLFVMPCVKGSLIPVADCGDSFFCNRLFYKIVLGRPSPPIAKGKVVPCRTSLVTVPLNPDFYIRMGLQE